MQSAREIRFKREIFVIFFICYGNIIQIFKSQGVAPSQHERKHFARNELIYNFEHICCAILRHFDEFWAQIQKSIGD